MIYIYTSYDKKIKNLSAPETYSQKPITSRSFLILENKKLRAKKLSPAPKVSSTLSHEHWAVFNFTRISF